VAVLEAGGGHVGEVITSTTADGRRVTWCYATDPDGNIVELQAWS
jgi:YD repeat-containing protein